MIGEAALIALAAAIYLADCVVLLERGQALIEAGWRGVTLSFGSKHYQISGRSVALMNPFTPFVVAFRSLVLFSSPVKGNVNLSKAVKVVAPLTFLAAMQFLLVFAALPYCLYRAPGWPFLIVLALAYLNAAAMLVWFFFRFKRSSIPTRPLIGLGFGWLICLPLSVNCLRAAGVSVALGVDATRALRFLPEKREACAALAAQIAEAMQEIDEADEQHGRLAALARQLEPEASRSLSS